ncbi:MAG: hypothetical protein J7501_00595 [Bdellovibrio sp.]|nr:hypothetical protein [Bdellovibrio sp.]
MRQCIFLILIAIVPNLAFAVDLNHEIDAGFTRQSKLHSQLSKNVGTSQYSQKKSKSKLKAGSAKVAAAPMVVRLKSKKSNETVTSKKRTVASRWQAYPPQRTESKKLPKPKAVRSVASKSDVVTKKSAPVVAKKESKIKTIVAKATKSSQPKAVASTKKKSSPERVAASVKKIKKTKKGLRGSTQKVAANS